MSKLKPCPFCGGEAKIQKVSDVTVDTDMGVDTIRSLVVAYCTSCNSRGEVCQSVIIVHRCGEMSIVTDGFKEAIEAWNKRAYDE